MVNLSSVLISAEKGDLQSQRPHKEVSGNFRSDCLRACLEIAFWVAQATGLCRPATRRTEWAGYP